MPEEKKIKLTLRVTEEEKRQIDEYARADQKSINQYLKDSALHCGSQGDGRLRCDIMRRLCQLDVQMRPSIINKDYDRLPTIVAIWEDSMKKALEV